MGEAAFERIAHEVVLVGARKGFHQQLAAARHLRAPLLDLKPFAHLLGQAAPGLRIGDDAAHTIGEIS